MLSTLFSGCIQGLRASLVKVEVDLQAGLPSFCVVGLPDTSVKESKERVRSAFKNSDFSFPMKRITVNLAPAHIPKEGSSFELAIALSLLMADQRWECGKFQKYLFLGELSLQGHLNSVRGILPVVLAAQKAGIEKVFVPLANAQEAAMVSTLQIYGIQNLKEIVQFLKDEISLAPIARDTKSLSQASSLDFSEVRGQRWAKKALEISAAGGHNILMMGPPGCGKSMLAQRLPSIFPPLSFGEALEVAQVYSVAGMMKKECHVTRPFRSPHHTVSYSALVGGGRGALMPGEISLAHRGVLFLDELSQFRKDVLEVLREPLEERKISICRTDGRYLYPADFLLVTAMNPCPCGYRGHPKKECLCAEPLIQKYQQKISGPLLDRIDLHVSVPSMSLEDLPPQEEEPSGQILMRVCGAREIQKKRFKQWPFFTNAQMTPPAIVKFCVLQEEAEKMLRQAVDQFGLSYRTYHKILRVSRTIADLDQKEQVLSEHVAQSIQLRFLDR
ncbi:MAG: YifB family Mg chelatase-like AAA ATPase [Deltaproteobacteria bacterium]|nr:YifB family Mg chelatase-like AAA ATPase [Deltaproteobacteria bacterium]